MPKNTLLQRPPGRCPRPTADATPAAHATALGMGGGLLRPELDRDPAQLLPVFFVSLTLEGGLGLLSGDVMGSTILYGGKRRGFNPKGNTVRPVEKCGSRVLPGLLAVLTLALGMMLSAASPAYAANLVVSTKAVPAPAGFHGVCDRYAWACDRSSHATVHGTKAQLELATRINRSVNRQVREISDQRQYQRREYWALPTRRGGDCEDFALLKKRELQRAGIAPDRLLIATVLDRRRQAHAVLVLRTDDGDYVLDNLTSRIKPWNKTGYSFIRMQDPRAVSGWTVVLRGGIFRT